MTPERPVRDENLETIRFLYEKRLTLFNVRREHEWKVFFAVITAMGLLDAAVVTQHVSLTGGLRAGWIAIFAVLTFACAAYEFEVQRRNRIDRIAMHELHDALCNSLTIKVEGYSCIRHPADHASKIPEEVPRYSSKSLLSIHFLWAFWWQIVVLLFVSIISVFFIPRITTQAGAGAGVPPPPTQSFVPTAGAATTTRPMSAT